MTLEQTKGKGIGEPDNLQDKRRVNKWQKSNKKRRRRDKNSQKNNED